MNRQTIAAVLLLTALCAGCRAQLARYRADFQTSVTDFADTIDIEWQKQLVFVPVVIGDQTYRFLLDTGAGQAVVFENSPFLSMCNDVGRIISHDAVGQSDTVRMVTLPPLTLGHTTLTGCQATVQRQSVSGRKIDGIIGFDIVVRGFCMKIDIKNRQLIISDRKDYFDRETGFDVRYRLNFHVPYITVNPFGNFTEEVLFDTGSRNFYSINKQRFDEGEVSLDKPLGQQVEGRSIGRHAIGHQGVEQRGEVVFLSLDRLKVGGLTFTDVHTITTQGGSHIGAALLEQCAVIFNPRRKRIRLQPYDNANEVAISNRQMEIAFVSERGLPVVGLVWERGEPYRQGFREGDTIIMIDGKPVNDISQFNRWAFEPGRSYRFTVRDPRGFQREVDWVRIPLAASNDHP